MKTASREAGPAPASATPYKDPLSETFLARLDEELSEQLAWELRRRDLEMRAEALGMQLDLALNQLQWILGRYQTLHAEGMVSSHVLAGPLQSLQKSAENVQRRLEDIRPPAR